MGHEMIKAVLTLVSPPLAACRFGCASCCAAPIAVFWLTGIVSILYGLAGGPARLMGPSWNTVALGVSLWAIASVWAAVTLRGYDAGNYEPRGGNPLRKKVMPSEDESDPLEEMRKPR